MDEVLDREAVKGYAERMLDVVNHIQKGVQEDKPIIALCPFPYPLQEGAAFLIFEDEINRDAWYDAFIKEGFEAPDETT